MSGLGQVERQRLQAIVDGDSVTMEMLHAVGFRLCTPSGIVWDRAHYLGGLADGTIRYLRFEPQGEIDCVEGERIGAVRYRSIIDVSMGGRPPGHLECWHLDLYQQDEDGTRQCRWSQATDTLRD